MYQYDDTVRERLDLAIGRDHTKAAGLAKATFEKRNELLDLIDEVYGPDRLDVAGTDLGGKHGICLRVTVRPTSRSAVVLQLRVYRPDGGDWTSHLHWTCCPSKGKRIGGHPEVISGELEARHPSTIRTLLLQLLELIDPIERHLPEGWTIRKQEQRPGSLSINFEIRTNETLATIHPGNSPMSHVGFTVECGVGFFDYINGDAVTASYRSWDCHDDVGHEFVATFCDRYDRSDIEEY